MKIEELKTVLLGHALTVGIMTVLLAILVGIGYLLKTYPWIIGYGFLAGIVGFFYFVIHSIVRDNVL